MTLDLPPAPNHGTIWDEVFRHEDRLFRKARRYYTRERISDWELLSEVRMALFDGIGPTGQEGWAFTNLRRSLASQAPDVFYADPPGGFPGCGLNGEPCDPEEVTQASDTRVTLAKLNWNRLTPRSKDILSRVAQGDSCAEIGRAVGLSRERTRLVVLEACEIARKGHEVTAPSSPSSPSSPYPTPKG